MDVQEIARHLNAQIEPAELALDVRGVATMEEATPEDITFLSNPKYLAKLKTCNAGAILVSEQFAATDLSIPLLRVAHPYLAFAKAIELFYPKPLPVPGVHPTAILGTAVMLGQNVSIGPYAVIGDRVRLGDNVTIHAHCTIYDEVQIGADSVLYSHVVVREGVELGKRVILQNGAIIGADGFGFVPMSDGTFYKILQAGTVILEDDVEVQSNSAIDRATIGTTRVEQGSKIDNLVQVGHGSKIGRHTLLCGQVGLAGSTEVGNHVILAGQVGVSGHLKIGDGAVAAAGSGIAQSVAPGTQVSGSPAIDRKLWLRVVAALKSLPNMLQRLRALENRAER